MPLPVIIATEPTVVPLIPSQTYDHYWLKQVAIDAHDPAEPIQITVILHKAVTVDGVTTLSPVDDDLPIVITDLFTVAADMVAADPSQPELLDAMAAVLSGIIAYAKFREITL